jgi:hypothetical protein
MPKPGKRWRHVVVNTHCSWLHGDRHGFRNRDHRVHSSGDYKNPPPEREHEGLRNYHAARSGAPVEIPVLARPIIGMAIVDNLTGRGHTLLALSVSKLHAHFVVELPDVVPAIKTIVGWAKQKSSCAVTHLLPGQIRGAGETYKPIDSPQHLRAAVDYVFDQRTQGAWVWCGRGAPCDRAPR